MTARNVTDLRQGLVMAKGDAAGFSAALTDEEIREFCRRWYGWERVRLVRDEAIVKAFGTPPSHTGKQRIDTRSMEEE